MTSFKDMGIEFGFLGRELIWVNKFVLEDNIKEGFFSRKNISDLVTSFVWEGGVSILSLKFCSIIPGNSSAPIAIILIDKIKNTIETFIKKNILQ